MFSKLVRNLFFRKEVIRPLGRWNPNEKPDLKAHYANLDSCGDSLCGNPIYYSENITDILEKKKTKKTP